MLKPRNIKSIEEATLPFNCNSAKQLVPSLYAVIAEKLNIFEVKFKSMEQMHDMFEITMLNHSVFYIHSLWFNLLILNGFLFKQLCASLEHINLFNLVHSLIRKFSYAIVFIVIQPQFLFIASKQSDARHRFLEVLDYHIFWWFFTFTSHDEVLEWIPSS